MNVQRNSDKSTEFQQSRLAFILSNSPGPYGRNQKHVGVFAAKHQNLHTGTVFDAERRETSHLAKKCHGPLKNVFF